KVAHVNIGGFKNPKSEILNPKQIQSSKLKIQKVVCGGVNLNEGMLVAFAKVGAKVKWHGEGDLVKLEKAKIRGVESSGMICSASEIGLENLFPQETEYHIIDLSDTAVDAGHDLSTSDLSKKIGQPLAKALGLDDVIIEIENKSLTNRPDLWSHYGMAREVAALLGLRLKVNKVNDEEIKKLRNKEIKGDANDDKVNKDKLKVDIQDSQKCPRYLGVVIDNIKIEPSPAWMSRQLEAIGVRSINNIVDITNYVLMELGQPLHAFDYDYIENHIIVVRAAKRGEKMQTIDNQTLELDTDDLVIADPKKPVALAGVMGGNNSEISDKTTKIIIESANFESSGIRRTESRTGLRTEASIRFEKALDPELSEQGIKRAIELILEICPSAKVTSSIVDIGNYKPQKNIIDLDLEYLNRVVGTEIPVKKVIEILTSLEFYVKPSSRQAVKPQALSVEVPSFRATRDITIEEDLIEEVARIFGYQNIKPKMPEIKLVAPEVNTERQLERQIKNILTIGLGFNEVQNYSFVDPKVASYFGYQEKDLIALDNPTASEQSHLRPNLLINLAKNIKDNLRFFDEFKLFEIGRVFVKGKGNFNTSVNSKEFLPKQDKYLSGVVVGKNVFEQAKSAVENLLEKVGVDCQLVPTRSKVFWADEERVLEIKSDGKNLGYIAEMVSKLRTKLKLKPRVGVFDLNFTELANLPKTQVKEFQELPIYPSVTRDLAIITSQGIMYSDIAEVINTISPLIIQVDLFDVYTGKNIGENKRSLAFHIIFRAPDRTLESKEVDKIFEQVVKRLEQKFGAKIRD
ncbi:phenylalanine--tRNA ligase subunit beta, partial [Patescibacteria group bacterium]|nr:phenylalanine--tRNA ligase subunit beta [Patescibacteria group bacterium]